MDARVRMRGVATIRENRTVQSAGRRPMTWMMIRSIRP